MKYLLDIESTHIKKAIARSNNERDSDSSSGNGSMLNYFDTIKQDQCLISVITSITLHISR